LREKQFAVGDRLTLQVVRVGEQVEVQTVSRDIVPVYWGYKVRVEKRSFGQLATDEKFDLTIATARIGDNFMDVASEIGEKWSSAQHVLVAFGAPTRGLHEIVKDEGLELCEIADFVVNMIPEQGTVTVRTEEALLASLSILNVHFSY
jgi:predicted SPOUT superfamily RNA methylase MTH1